MDLYVVQAGDTVASIAQGAGIPISQIIYDNGLSPPYPLVVGQCLVLRYPQQVYTAQMGDSLYSVARKTGLSIRQLYRNNPILGGLPTLYPGQTLVLQYRGAAQKQSPITVNDYAYPFIDQGLLQESLPFLTYLSPFTYGIQPDGSLVPLNDNPMLEAARGTATGGLMHLSTLTDEGSFSNELAHLVLNDLQVQGVLLDSILITIQEKAYFGLDVDFEFLFAEDAQPYADFVQRLHDLLHPLGLLLVVALAPKTSATQPGLLYEGHDYRALGAAADRAFLMTYEWGYTYGPPMAVAPLPNVRRVVEYALTEMPPEKLWLGIPSYGYDWPLPYRQGETKATSLSPVRAVQLAQDYGVSIQYDDVAQAPWFQYSDQEDTSHIVWFEDGRSIAAKLQLVNDYGLSGVGYWNLMRRFPQNWMVLDSLFGIQDL